MDLVTVDVTALWSLGIVAAAAGLTIGAAASYHLGYCDGQRDRYRRRNHQDRKTSPTRKD